MESTWTRPSDEEIRKHEQAQVEYYKKMEDERVSKFSEEERKKYEECKKQTEKQALVLAEKLERSLWNLQRFVRSLKGEIVDLTGFGMERIFLDSLERALDIHILSHHCYDYFLDIEKKYKTLTVTNESTNS